MKRNRDVMMRILARQTRPQLRMIVEQKFHSAKEKLLREVAAHPISVDINSHARSPLLSGSKTGTLYGFLGFDQMENPDPIEDLIDFLDATIIFEPRMAQTKNRLFSSVVVYPDKEAFNKARFHLPWSSRGWPLMVEEGVSGLPYYINKPSKNSFSGEGIQIDHPVRQGDFAPPANGYLSPLLASFRRRLLLS